MARYGSHRGGSYGKGSGGFTKSNGTRVSLARAHQHVGQSFGGYAKVRSAGGGFRMKKSK